MHRISISKAMLAIALVAANFAALRAPRSPCCHSRHPHASAGRSDAAGQRPDHRSLCDRQALPVYSEKARREWIRGGRLCILDLQCVCLDDPLRPLPSGSSSAGGGFRLFLRSDRSLFALDRLSDKGLRCSVFSTLRDSPDYSDDAVWSCVVTRPHDWLVDEWLRDGHHTSPWAKVSPS